MRSGKEVGDTYQGGGLPDTGKNWVVERFCQHRNYTLLWVTQTCVCCRYIEKCKPITLENILCHSDSSFSVALASSNNIPHASIKTFPQFPPQSLFLTLQADSNRPSFNFPSLPSSQLPKKSVQSDSSQSLWASSLAGVKQHLTLTVEEEVAIWITWARRFLGSGNCVRARMAVLSSVISMELPPLVDGRWEQFDIQISTLCSDPPHFRSATEVWNQVVKGTDNFGHLKSQAASCY